MTRPIALFSSKWAGEPFADFCRKVSGWGYDGLEIACFGDHFDFEQGASNPSYIKEKQKILADNSLVCCALSAHKAGHCVGSHFDPRYAGLLPAGIRGTEAMREWGISQVKLAVQAAHNLGVTVLVGFMGSPIWPYWYSYPPTTQALLDEGYAEIKALWDPLFDAMDKLGIRFALEVHPTDIAFDFYSSHKLLDVFEHRETLGFTMDPSHFVWQGMNPALFVRDFASRIYHVHMKDVSVNKDGRAGVLGSFLEFGDTRRFWNPRTLGRGAVDFEELTRELNAANYQGALSVEWEDNGMEKDHSAVECLQFVRHYNYS
ncbi:sugar phosphate isomerase/epimerase, partial [Desulfovibrio sp. OttesenSCG-928-I05]|nr:sugar phosphate isomerase/epimerase [Desulfovibrio sp. OttesenSCG-928-I05]